MHHINAEVTELSSGPAVEADRRSEKAGEHENKSEREDKRDNEKNAPADRLGDVGHVVSLPDPLRDRGGRHRANNKNNNCAKAQRNQFSRELDAAGSVHVTTRIAESAHQTG
jgi:hypothetical protein